MTKNDAISYAPEQIRVNSIHPGYIWTPMVENHLRATSDDLEAAKAAAGSVHPVGHMGERLKQLCEENCVSLAEVPPAYTSQYCPACGHVEKGNRRSTVLVGARNIRDLYLGRISVPHAKS